MTRGNAVETLPGKPLGMEGHVTVAERYCSSTEAYGSTVINSVAATPARGSAPTVWVIVVLAIIVP